MGRKAVSVDTKKKIITLSELDLSKTAIAERCNVSRNCVIQTIRKYDKERTVSTKPGGGRPSKLSERQKRSIKLEQLRDDTLSVNDLTRYVQTFLGVTIGRSTVSRILNEFDMISYVAPKKPKIKPIQRKRRVSWCYEHRGWSNSDWSHVVFSDESRFELVNRNNRIYIRRHRSDKRRLERSQPRTHQGGGLSVWGCLTYYGLSNLVFYEGKMNSLKYIEMLDANLPSVFNLLPVSCYQRKIFQQDNAKPHVSAKTMAYFERNRINVLPWPANSPDINIIENVWSIIDDKLLKYSISNSEELKEAIIDIWNQISIERIKKLYSSIPNRLEQVIQRKGFSCSS